MRLHLFGLAFLFLLATGSPGADARVLHNSGAPANCRERSNDTVAKLEQCIVRSELWGELAQFQRIADDKLREARTGLWRIHQGRARPGVLRRLAPHWLRANDMRSVVLGFEEAARAHGGSGALYVRLRRRLR